MADLSKKEIIELLSSTDKESLYKKAYEVKKNKVGTKVYFRGLIEFSNICSKNCLYCGLRRGNIKLNRYELSDEEIIDSVNMAKDCHYGSVVLQSGELSSPKFTARINSLLKKIKDQSHGEIGITLSCGEQNEETYREWFEAGAHRYLLRIESSNKDLYYKIHPNDKDHSFESRINSLRSLKEIGYQVGSGMMVGLPFQTLDHIADDLLFLKNIDCDMAGLGPYVEHSNTPLYEHRDSLLPKEKRFELALKCISILRIMMEDINIAAATALQSIDPEGREKALLAGANIIMPNLTPTKYRSDYLLYENKPCIDESAMQCKACLAARIKKYGETIGYDEWGDSRHFAKRRKPS